MSDEHPWVKLCELAMCSPDFDVVYRFDRDQACEWLHDRIARRARYARRLAPDAMTIAASLVEIETAYDQWTEHLRQAKGVDLGTMRLDG